MRAVLQVSLMAFCVALSVAAHTPGLLSQSPDLSLMQFMLRTRDLTQVNSARSMDCFTYYVPVLNDITAQYEESYARCLDSAEAKREGIDNSTQGDRVQIERAATTSCEALNQCSQWENSITYFECYVRAGSDNSKTMYTISANASDVLAHVREEYRLIDNDQNRCTNQSERAYVEDTAYTYDQLQSCLQGKSPVPSTTPPTDTTTTTEDPTTADWWWSTPETTEDTTWWWDRNGINQNFEEKENSDARGVARKDVLLQYLQKDLSRSKYRHE